MKLNNQKRNSRKIRFLTHLGLQCLTLASVLFTLREVEKIRGTFKKIEKHHHK